MTAIVAGGVFAFTNRPMIYEMIGISPQDVADARALRAETQQPQQLQTQQPSIKASVVVNGTASSVLKSPDGQFWAQAQVNSSSIKFLIDTGASVVALTPLDAQMAGFQPQDLRYTSTVSTASGKVKAAKITLDIVSVGNVTVRNVTAVVISEGLEHSLLGMSYLGKLQRVEVTQSALILRQ